MIYYRNRYKCYIIAEIGVNHDGCIEKAKNLVDLAVSSGANAVKFQSFYAEDLATADTPKVEYQLKTTGNKQSHFEMLKALELSVNDEAEIFNYCKSIGVNFISTPYSLAAVKQLEQLGVEEYKIASADIVDIPLLEAVAATGKPVILSLGMASLGEIEVALNCFSHYKDEDIVLLHCVSNYPCSDSSLNLNVIKTLNATFQLPIGFSDHSEGIVAAPTSLALGACVIEKHFTSDKTLPGPDHRASIEPAEFKSLVENVRRVEKQLGHSKKEIQKEETTMALVSRKSLVYSRDLKKGHILERSDFSMKRPGTGLKWEYLENLCGRKTLNDVSKDQLCCLEDVR